MANTKQAQKMIRKTKTRTQYNRWWTSKVKDAIKSLQDKKDSSAKDIDLTKDISNLQKTVDKAVKSGVIKKSKGNRIKSSAVKYAKN